MHYSFAAHREFVINYFHTYWGGSVSVYPVRWVGTYPNPSLIFFSSVVCLLSFIAMMSSVTATKQGARRGGVIVKEGARVSYKVEPSVELNFALFCFPSAMEFSGGWWAFNDRLACDGPLFIQREKFIKL